MRTAKRFQLFLAGLLIIASLTQGYAAGAYIGEETITSAAAIVVDFETGLELYSHNPDEQRVPASMTKLVNIYVVYEAISAGEIALDTQVRISDSVYRLSNDWTYSNVALSRSEIYTVSELLDIVIVNSACGAAAALAELVGGTLEAFVGRMNDSLGQLGVDAQFYDCFGASNKNRISPRGMSVLARSLLMNHPEVLNKTSQGTVVFRGVTYKNTNALLGSYSGIDGLKTGTSTAAGSCFTGTAERDGRRIISVTMGSAGARRFADTVILLDYGFAEAPGRVSEYEQRLREEREEQERREREEREREELMRIEAAKVPPTTSEIIFNGEAFELSAYLIEDSNYVRIRDLALLLSETKSRFNVEWDEEARAVILTSGVRYIPVGSEMTGRSTERKTADDIESATLILDGEQAELSAKSIDDEYYFKLRDIAEAFAFEVVWNEAENTVIITAEVTAESAY